MTRAWRNFKKKTKSTL